MLGAAARGFITEPLAEAANAAARRGLVLGLWWVGTLFILLLVLTFASVGAFLAMADSLSPAVAALTVAAGLTLIAAVAGWVAWRHTAKEPPPVVKPAAAGVDLATLVLNVGLAAGEAFFNGRKGR